MITWAAPIHIVTVTDDFASIASEIGGDHVVVQSLVTGSKNLHSIQARPSMVMTMKTADMVIRLGMGEDAWVDGLIQAARRTAIIYGQPGYVDASTAIQALEVPTSTIDGSMGDIHAQGNPHYWLNPMNGVSIAALIADRLGQLDPKNASYYSRNYDAFKHKIMKKSLEWNQKISILRNINFVSYHKVWSYFFDYFKLNTLGELEPIPGIEPTTKHLYALSKRIAHSSKPVIVLTASFYSKDIGASFAKKHGYAFKHVASNVGANGITTYDELFDYLIHELTQ